MVLWAFSSCPQQHRRLLTRRKFCSLMMSPWFCMFSIVSPKQTKHVNSVFATEFFASLGYTTRGLRVLLGASTCPDCTHLSSDFVFSKTPLETSVELAAWLWPCGL